MSIMHKWIAQTTMSPITIALVPSLSLQLWPSLGPYDQLKKEKVPEFCLWVGQDVSWKLMLATFRNDLEIQWRGKSQWLELKGRHMLTALWWRKSGLRRNYMQILGQRPMTWGWKSIRIEKTRWSGVEVCGEKYGEDTEFEDFLL